MFSYLAYGLRIASNRVLPELQPGPRGGDVVITFDPTARVPREAAGQAWYVRISSDEAVLADHELGVFVLRGGRTVTVIPAAGADEAAVRLYLVGTIMAILLYQRGRLPLHASAIAIGGEAVGFLGVSGAGKSTMAAALQARGHRVVADDVTALRVGDGQVLTYPAFPLLKLMPEAAASAGCDVSRLESLHAGEEKHGFRAIRSFAGQALPLRRLYVLADGPETRIEKLRPQEAVVEFVRHSYPTRMLQPGGPAHFLLCAELARTVPTYRLTRARSLPSLREVARRVEDDLLTPLRIPVSA
jgi:hypothetical protein